MVLRGGTYERRGYQLRAVRDQARESLHRRPALPAVLPPQVPPYFRDRAPSDGVDIRTLQGWMGHRDIQATMVYLKGIQSKEALVKVNGGSPAAYVA